LFRKSALYRTPSGVRVRWNGYLKAAVSPKPSAKVAVPLPAIVPTLALESVMERMR
jgi:hypothetical protein